MSKFLQKILIYFTLMVVKVSSYLFIKNPLHIFEFITKVKNKFNFKEVYISDYFLEETQQFSENTGDQLSVENIANYNATEENISSNNKKISEETISLSITEKLKHGVDYASSILNSANEWLKEMIL